MTSSSVPLTGSIVALVTPMHEDGSVDYLALRKLIDWHIQEGTDCIGVVGTTGESPTVNVEEHCEIIRVAVEQAAKRVPIMAGCGANSTAEAIELTEAAAEVGATGTLQVCPYYNKPSQEGLYRHFKAIAECSDLPVMLYSIPGRSVIEISVETIARLANDCPTIVSVKEAGGKSDRVNQLIQAVPEGFTILSGDDPLTLPFMACGAVGLVSVASNLIPEVMVSLVNACRAGNFTEALAIQKKYYPLISGLMSIEVNPVPIKTAVALQGHCSDELRLPLAPLNDTQLAKLKAILTSFNLL
ncbi:MAG: 4-hydroxy-tetrahydrodipicolinate synthase [Burkholderiaceae bacterium]|nr:4-hydroxy-tetrahydrodipicolinate synthase [Burkholderiaceae bacterium]